MNTFSFTATHEQAGKRVDAVLAKLHASFSRAIWNTHIKLGNVSINNKTAKVSDKLSLGSEVTGTLPVKTSATQLIAPAIQPEIIYQDKNVLVINKPAGLIVHPTNKTAEPSVAGAFASMITDDDPLRPGIVHRLDKDTSGVMILARHKTAKEYLQAQFKSRKVTKHYIALVVGQLKNAHARLELPVRRGIKNPQKMNIEASGKPAISEYTLILEYGDYSLLDIAIFTGRTHQIRVQFAHIGHPIVGDKMYGSSKNPVELNRQFLHASSLGIKLPTGEAKVFIAPIANDLQHYLNILKSLE